VDNGSSIAAIKSFSGGASIFCFSSGMRKLAVAEESDSETDFFKAYISF
jgi:hypothetical protein